MPEWRSQIQCQLLRWQHNMTNPTSRVFLALRTIESRILLGGVDGFFTRGVPRLNVPRFKMADGPFGVRNFGPDTAIAGGIALAATWNPALAQEVGTELGRDARAKEPV